MVVARFARLAMVAEFARRFGAAGDLIRRALEAAQRLAQRLDLAFVAGLLALGFLDEFQQFVQRFDCVA